jgi:hypothetical protein
MRSVFSLLRPCGLWGTSSLLSSAVNRLGVILSIHLYKKVTVLMAALYPKVYRHFDVAVAMLLAHTMPLCTHSNVTQFAIQRSVLERS